MADTSCNYVLYEFKDNDSYKKGINTITNLEIDSVFLSANNTENAHSLVIKKKTYDSLVEQGISLQDGTPYCAIQNNTNYESDWLRDFTADDNKYVTGACDGNECNGNKISLYVKSGKLDEGNLSQFNFDISTLSLSDMIRRA